MGIKKINRIIRYILFSAITFSNLNSYCQELEWLSVFEGGSSKVESIEIDESKSIYSIGYFGGISYWTEQDFSTSFGGFDIFLLKHNINHELQWSYKFGSTFNDLPKNLIYDNDNNLIFSGDIGRNSIFYDTIISLSNNSSYQRNYFIAKYDTNANRKWLRMVNDSSISLTNIYDLKIDDYGNIYLLGSMYNKEDTIYGMPNKNIILLKYNTNGDLLWQKQFTESFGSYKCSLSVSDSIFFLVYQKVKYEENIFYTNKSAILRLDSLGNIMWEKEYNSQYIPNKNCLTIDDQQNIYFLSQSYEYIPYSYYYDNDFTFFTINKIDKNNIEIWSKKIEGVEFPNSYDGLKPSYIICKNDNLYISSAYSCLRVKVNNEEYGDENNSFILKFSSDGNFNWFKDYAFIEINDFAFMSANKFYIAGKKNINGFIALVPDKEQIFTEKGYPYVYPNPCHTYINIISEDYFDKNYKLEILNINGKLIDSYMVNHEPFQINLSSYPRGVYFIKFIKNEVFSIKKVIVQ